MTTVAFVVHPDRPRAAELAERAGEWLLARGHKVEPVLNDAEHPHDEEGEDIAFGLRGEIPGPLTADDIDLAVSLGGDGTMLRTVEMTAPRGIPVLGVNLGHLGYLTEVEPSNLEGALEKFVEGDYRIEERMTLDVSLERRNQPHPGPDSEQAGTRRAEAPFHVLNEAVVERTQGGHTIRVSAQIAGRPFVTYAADGLLVSTPTGSTAYNLSLRGPIVSPQLWAILVTPISPHMLFDRSLILAPDEWLRLEVAPPRAASVVLDGRAVAQIEPGDAIVCRPGGHPARLVTFGPRDFHAILRARFNLADR